MRAVEDLEISGDVRRHLKNLKDLEAPYVLAGSMESSILFCSNNSSTS